MEVTPTKNWIEIGEHNRPEVITVNLLADEEAINIINKSDQTDWEYLFTDTGQYEDMVKDYRAQMNAIILPQHTDAVFSNIDPTNVQLGTEITGKKYWLDDESESRPNSIVVYLLANGARADKQVITAHNDWQYRFTNVPEYDVDREKIIYTVVEEKIEGYDTRYEGYDLINLRVGITEVNILKKWVSGKKENRPESIQVDLLQNGRKIQSVELSEAQDWQYSFTNLPEFDEKGKAYNYTIKDKAPKELKTHPVRIATKKDRLLDQTEVSRIAAPVIGGVILLLGLLAGRKRKN